MSSEKNSAPRKRRTRARLNVNAAGADGVHTARKRKLGEVAQVVQSQLRKGTTPLTAYELIGRVERLLHRQLHPPTIYRALSYLVRDGLVHRLETDNTYIACGSPGEPHQSVIFVCNECGSAEESTDRRAHQLLLEDAEQRQFAAENRIIEIRGVCGNCTAAK